MEIRDIDEGKILISSDIQGNWDDYKRVRDRFDRLKKEGRADILVFDGDLVHGYTGYEDKSLEILDDLIDNQDQSVIPVLGNHELMHIYHMKIGKGDIEDFAGPLEDRIEDSGKGRERYVKLMKKMPYAIRTKGGVTILHTGANPPMAGMLANEGYRGLLEKTDGFELIKNLDHNLLLNELTKVAKKIDGLSEDYFDDGYLPVLGDVFSQSDIGCYLWDVFFNGNEEEYGRWEYGLMLEKFLKTMSHGNREQRFLIAGHMKAKEGYEVVLEKQLRISTSHGAKNDSKKTLALVDASRKYSRIDELVKDLIPLF